MGVTTAAAMRPGLKVAWIILSPVCTAVLPIVDAVSEMTGDGKGRGMSHTVTASGGTTPPPLVTH